MSAERALIDRAFAYARVDWSPTHEQPPIARVMSATALAVVVALLADAVLVAIATAVFPSTAGYEHFRFDDYAKLTIIGVVCGCAGWPVVTRLSSAPRWLFFRLAILATLVLFLPDVWLLMKGQPLDAVAVLMAMHVAVALVTYNAVVRIAPVPRTLRRAG